MTDTQTVADTDAPAKPATEDKGAQEPSIDELLKQFEQTETPPEQTNDIKADDLKADDIKEVVSFVKETREDRIRETTDKDVSAAVKAVKGDLDIDEGLVKELLYGKASTDPRFLRAFQLRHENPEGWTGVQQAFGRELASRLAKPDQGLTDDRAAVEAAVRSASTGSSEEPPPDFGSMTDSEFNAWQSKNIR